MNTFRRTIFFSSILVLAWAASIAFAVHVLAHNGNASVAAPTQFPKDAALSLAPDRPTLVILTDPQGENARESLHELARVMAESQAKMKAYVLFARPADAGANWADNDLWREAANIPGVVPVGDNDGRETRRFGGDTSGQTLLFAADGRLVFSGDIAQSRGQTREQANESSVHSLQQRLAEATAAPALVAR